MNRKLTNAIRFVMDECIPPAIRDSRIFMYPFFSIWFKGSNIKKMMSFKTDVMKMSDQEFSDFYVNMKTMAVDRPSDTTEGCIEFAIKNFDASAKTLLDVGCGRAYFLNKVAEKTSLELTGLDFYDSLDLRKGNYVKGNIEHLPFADNAFDIVTCNHTIEHLRNLPKAISELKRVAKNQLIIITPCQQYFYYTLDTHIHFFPYEAKLTSLIDMKNFSCRKVDGDWVYVGTKN